MSFVNGSVPGQEERSPTDGGGVNPWIFWAKWSPKSRSPQSYHPLLCHMVDVAVVTQAMWSEVLPPSARQRFAGALGLPEEEAGLWIAFWAGLHDLGKASPAFQVRADFPGVELMRTRLRDAGLPCPTSDPRESPHGMVSMRALRELLPERFGMQSSLSSRVATVVGGHHGTLPSSGDVQCLSPEAVGKKRWQEARANLADWLKSALDLPPYAPTGALDNATAMALAGFISVADWIGSNEDYFRHAAEDALTAPNLNVVDYTATARMQAHRALDRLGWLGWTPPERALPFEELFASITDGRPVKQRPVQAATVELADRIEGPGLVVVEAPMGEGKTEAAMYLADRWGVSLGQRGCYFALPTQATSNQMFERVERFLTQRYPDQIVNLQLLHGHAALSAMFQELQRNQNQLFTPDEIYGEGGSDGARANIIAAEWFTGRKRGLLAPFGVGTVDQGLLAVLQTRHVFVRLFGLAAKTVIVDEVHAYDTYMTTLLVRLLEWLGALGTSVVLLSATLPGARRRELLEGYARGAGWELPQGALDAAYPRLSWTSASDTGARRVETSTEMARELQLAWVDGSLPNAEGAAFGLGARLQHALAGGGCAAVICNTVKRAQEVYSALKPYFGGTADDGEPVLDLLHARFLFKDREEREERALQRFGKGGQRPHRAVLVSTQIIEQSLDLDFDLMVSDHAPADLLLQRSGRLHRHRRDRSPGLEAPTLWICEPERLENGVPGFDRGTEAVYDAHILLRSWLELRDRESVSVPGDVEQIIEAVYDDGRPRPPNLDEPLRLQWEETRLAQEKQVESEEVEAQQRYIKPPRFDGLLDRLVSEPREEDAPELHPAHQALTRLIDISIPVICLHMTEHGKLLGEGGEPVDRSATPDVALAKRLLARSVNVTDRRVAYALLREDAPSGWRKSALLRHHRVVALDSAGEAMVEGFRLQLDPELGLRIHGPEV